MATSSANDALDIGASLSRAQAHWNAGQADEAERLCQRVLHVWPGQADALHLLGLIAHAYGNLDLAVAHLRAACNAPRAPALYYSNFAEMCRQKGSLAEGMEAGRRAVALAPNLASAWNNLGILQQEAGEFEQSRVALERVAALTPNSAEAHNNLGNTLKRMGQLDAAEARYTKAIGLRPEYAEALSNLASLLHDRGDLEGAVRSAKLAIEKNPQLADAYLNLAGIEIERSQPHEALRWLNALAEFAPLHAQGMSARARTLRELDRLDEALTVARQAVALEPQNASVHHTLGLILQALGKHEEAIASLARATNLPGVVREEAMLARGSALLEAGRNKESELAYAEAAAAFPQSAKAIVARVETKRYEAGDPDMARVENFLRNETSAPRNDRICAHFAIAKMYLDTEDSARAFEHLRIGNSMKRATFKYDAAASDAWMQRIAHAFPKSLLQRLGGSGHPSHLPIFVLGMPRSGTTLIEQILASHPLVHGAGELPAVRQTVECKGPFPDFVATLTAAECAALGLQYLQRVAPLSSRKFLVDKMPANFLHAGLIHLMLPNARMVHCRRNAVDTTLSCYTKLFAAEQLFTYDFKELAHFHRAYQRLVTHWREVLPANRFIEIDYEAVVDDLPGQTRRLLDALQLPWDDACLRFHETERVVRTASVAQVRKPLYSSSKGRWRKYREHLTDLLEALDIRETKCRVP